MRPGLAHIRSPLARVICAGALCLGLAGCQPTQTKDLKVVKQVQTIALALSDYEPDVRLTGDIEAQYQNDVSFRVSGRILERKADVGDHVVADQILATIDPQEQNADVAAAQAVLDSAAAQLRQVVATFDRQKELLVKGFTTRREYDQADAAARTAKGSVDSASAQLSVARERLADTQLKAGVAGVITARNVEAGQVVQAAQAAFTIAQDGPRDAVFNVYESLLGGARVDRKVEVALLSDPKTIAWGDVREIAPTVDMTTGTIRVKIGLDDPPATMTLGALVSGVGHIRPRKVLRLPPSALSALARKPAVWIVDPKTEAVSLRNFTIDLYRTDEIIVADGLSPGDIVVTKGAQLLRPGEIVAPVVNGGS